MDLASFLLHVIKRLWVLLNIPLTKPLHYYNAGLVFLFIAFICLTISPLLFEYIIFVPLALYGWGYTIDALSFIKEIWKSDFNKKALFVIHGTIISLPSYIMANHIVNKVTGLPPSDFDSSVAVLSILIMPKLFLITGTIALLMATLWHFASIGRHVISTTIKFYVSQIILQKHEKQNLYKKEEVLLFSRVMGAFLLVVLFIKTGDFFESYEDKIFFPLAEEIIIQTDYYEKSPCENIQTNDRVAFLKDGRISVATQEKSVPRLLRFRPWSFDNTKNCIKHINSEI